MTRVARLGAVDGAPRANHRQARRRLGHLRTVAKPAQRQQAGRNRRQGQQDIGQHRAELDRSARRVPSVRDDELRLVYQPIVDLSTGRVSGLEALVRWYHPMRGSIRPSEFIPVAEQSDLIVDLGTWVLRRAMLDAAGWPRGTGTPTTVSVNVSPRQLTLPGFPELVEELLQETGLPGSRLCLELTETALVGDVVPVVTALRALRDLDVRLAIDDFGTGHASLSYLTQFPVDTVKVDQSFVAGVATDAGSAAIVRAITAMCGELGIRVLAEGIETRAERDFLARAGIDLMQGYFFCKPVFQGLGQVAEDAWR